MTGGGSAPRLSIVTVVKDDPVGLARTLASVVSQDLSDVEYLVVDSSTGSGVAPSLVDAGLADAVYEWTAPAGVYPAMNRALASTSGRYVHFLNAGDAYADDTVVARLQEALRSGDPVWAYGQVRFIDGRGVAVVPPPFDYARERATLFSRGRFPPHQGTIVRADVLRSLGGFDTSYRIVADYAVALGLSRMADPVELPWLVADFYQGGVSSIAWKESLREFHRARREILRPQGASAWRERGEYASQWCRMTVARAARR
jgi:glycosyltransferase involved in cell wall biosynthesis